MEQDTGQPTPEAQQGTPETSQAEGEERTFTQKDVDKIMGNVRREQTTALVGQLGYGDLDSLKSDVGSLRQQREAAKTDLEKSQEAQQTLQSELEAAYERIFNGEVRQSLRDSGVPQENVRDVMRLLDLDGVDVGEDGTLTGLEEQVQALQGRLPALFGGDSPPAAPRRAPQLGGGAPAAPGSRPDSEQAFNQLLRQRAYAADG